MSVTRAAAPAKASEAAREPAVGSQERDFPNACARHWRLASRAANLRPFSSERNLRRQLNSARAAASKERVADPDIAGRSERVAARRHFAIALQREGKRLGGIG